MAIGSVRMPAFAYTTAAPVSSVQKDAAQWSAAPAVLAAKAVQAAQMHGAAAAQAAQTAQAHVQAAQAAHALLTNAAQTHFLASHVPPRSPVLPQPLSALPPQRSMSGCCGAQVFSNQVAVTTSVPTRQFTGTSGTPLSWQPSVQTMDTNRATVGCNQIFLQQHTQSLPFIPPTAVLQQQARRETESPQSALEQDVSTHSQTVQLSNRQEVQATVSSCSEAIDPDQAVQKTISEATSSVALRTCLVKALATTVNFELLESGYQQCMLLEQEAWESRLRKNAMDRLTDELLDKQAPPLWLEKAIERATEAGLDKELILRVHEEVSRRQVRRQAEEALLDSVAKQDAEALMQRITRAEEAGVQAHLLDFTRQRLKEIQQIEQKEKRRSLAEMSLAELLLSDTPSASIALALDEALEACVQGNILAQGWRRKVAAERSHWKAQIQEAQRKSSFFQDPSLTQQLSSRGKDRCACNCSCSCSASSAISRRSSGVGHDLSARATLPPRLPGSQCAAEVESSVVSSEQAPFDANLEQADGKTCTQTFGRRSPTSGGIKRNIASPRHSATEELPCYGLDAELKAKAAAKYDPIAEEEAAKWVQAVTGEDVVSDFFDALRTGQVLCQLVNCISPGVVPKINAAGMPFKERENISNFLKACRVLGVQEYALFSTDDLYDQKNLMSVVKCLFALGGSVQRTTPDFKGPHLGVADTSNARRDQKRSLGQASQTAGFHGPMERSHIDVVSNQIVRGGS